MRERKRVSFATTQRAYCNPHDLSVEDLKALCWYSETEMGDSREDARLAIEALQNAGGNVEAVDDAKTCMRGIEKYGDVMAKVMGQRRHIQSVLDQQDTNRKNRTKDGDIHLSVISKFLSQPFIQMAQFYAARNAEEAIHSKEAHQGDSAAKKTLTICHGNACNQADTIQLCAKRKRDVHSDSTDMFQRRVKACVQ